MKRNTTFSMPIKTLLIFTLFCGFGTSHTSAKMILENSSYVEEPSFLNDTQDRYTLVDSGINEIGPTLYLKYEAQKKIYFTQVYKGKNNLLKNHKQIEKTGKWNLVPSDTIISQEKKYIIAISEVYVDNKIYTVIVQTYDTNSNTFGDLYSREEILHFTESLHIEYAIKKFL